MKVQTTTVSMSAAEIEGFLKGAIHIPAELRKQMENAYEYLMQDWVIARGGNEEP